MQTYISGTVQTVRKVAAIFSLVVYASFPATATESDNKYLEMSIAELLNVEVSSVSKKVEGLRNAGAAIFVVTSEDIRRSGALSIPEALRMVPGINVARINANAWAVTSRGFNGRFANKLLVLMDGRSVYGDSFSGVYWDTQDTVMEDIDRIEVIRGPGATLWGSNAVNGIINIITKHTIDSQGGLLVTGGGSHERQALLRYGGSIGDNTHARAYVKATKQDAFVDGLYKTDAGDSWDSLRVGFRADSEFGSSDTITVQGDMYDNNLNQMIQIWQQTAPYQSMVNDHASAQGRNVLMRWEHEIADENTTTLQVYHNYTKRQEAYVGQQYVTLDIDFQHNFQISDWQHLVWGAGFRTVDEEVKNTFSAGLITDDPTANLFSGFVQDNMKLGSDALQLVVGSKFEKNDYTGWEIQPNLRLTWIASDTQTLWAAVSKASRTPTRYEEYMQAVAYILPPTQTIPVPIVVQAKGNRDFKAEKLLAYEAGYRSQPTETISFDVALFYNVYDNLLTFEQSSTQPIVTASNLMYGSSYGGELVLNHQMAEWWQVHLAYSYLETQLKLRSGSTGSGALRVAQGSTPKHQVSLRSNMTIFDDIELDIWTRYTGKLEHPSDYSIEPSITTVDAYMEADIRIAWQANQDMEISFLGKNLLHKSHLEFIHEAFLRPTLVERSWYGKVTLKF